MTDLSLTATTHARLRELAARWRARQVESDLYRACANDLELALRDDETLHDALAVEAVGAAVHDLRWCKSSDLLHALAHDADDEDGYRARLEEALRDRRVGADDFSDEASNFARS